MSLYLHGPKFLEAMERAEERDPNGSILPPHGHLRGFARPRLAEATFTEHLHPRDRLGKWIRSLGLPAAYEVGGAVRDDLLGKNPKDIDFMVMAAPEEIKAAVEKAGGIADELVVRDRLVGVRAHMPGVTPPEGVEIAPPRIEVSTGPGRHDFQIVPHPYVTGEASAARYADEPVTGHLTPVGNPLVDDARRRDFTVNALYRDGDGNVVDPTGMGADDLQRGVLRTTHPDSFRDDPLRILRGARFASQHGLEPSDETFRQMTEHADAMTALTQKGTSGTVLTEMDKLLAGDHPGKGLRLLRDTGGLGVLFPELADMVGYDQMSPWHDLSLDEHTIRVVEEVAKQGGSLDGRWAALLHDMGKPDVAFQRDGPDDKRRYYAAPENGMVNHEDAGVDRARILLNRINMPGDRKDHILTIIREHMLRDADKPTPVRARRLRSRLSDAVIHDLIIQRRADQRSKSEDDDPLPTPQVDKLEALLDAEAAAGAPRSLSDLAINGRDLIGLGATGPQVGEILNALLTEVVNQPNVNRHEWLIARAAKMLRKTHG